MPVAFVAIRPIVVFIRRTGGQLKDVSVLSDPRWQVFQTADAVQWAQTNNKNKSKKKLPLVKVSHLFTPLPAKCLNKVTFLVCN